MLEGTWMTTGLETVGLGLVWYVAFLFSVTFHEAAHAWTAWRGGDPTAYHGGQVSLDPLPHIRREPFGTVVLPGLSYLLGGWMIGWASTPYDPFWAERHPRRAAWMALAGPVANLALVLIAALAIRLGIAIHWLAQPTSVTFTHVVAAAAPGVLGGVATLLSILFSLNLVLCLFNLMPMPPLDGSGVLALFMRPERALQYQAFLRQPVFTYVGLFIAWQLSGFIIGPTHLLAVNLLYPGGGYH
jgi:Zn-dependent protease